MRIFRDRARSGYLFFASTVALGGCAAILGIDDRTADTDGSVATPDGGGMGDHSTSEGALPSDGGNLNLGGDGQPGTDAPVASDAQAAGDTQADRTVQNGSDAQGGADATSAGDALGGGDGPGVGDGRGDSDAGRDAGGDVDSQGGADAKSGSDAQPDAASCPDPCPIQKGLNHPYFVASDANRVYWTEYGDDQGSANGAVKSCPVAGCGSGPTVYTSSQINPVGIAVDGQNVYWGSASYGGVVGAIWSCPIGGCTSPTRLATAGIPYGVAVDSNYVYWVDNDDGTVHRVAKISGADSVLYDAGSSVLIEPGQCAVDTAFVYVSDRNNTIARIPVTGGEPVVITSGLRGGYFGIISDSTNIYFGESGQILRAAKTSTDGGVPLASNVPWPDGLALDPATGTIYWSDYGTGSANDGTVGKVGVDGGGETVLASSLPTPEAVAVSDNYVFWLSWGTLDSNPMNDTGTFPSTGALLRTAK